MPSLNGFDDSLGIVGRSEVIREHRDHLRRVGASDGTALVIGPSGAGKELAARAIHVTSHRAARPFVTFNCANLSETMAEAELFGHERGAFTGADRARQGLLALVDGGTLFMDEIAELPPRVQPKLLRVLETGRYRPIGASHELVLNGRIVVATHADLRARAAAGIFREDLLWRLDVLPVPVPSLADRVDDIPILLAVRGAAQRRQIGFATCAADLCRRTPWPGNVRQLFNFVDRVSALEDVSAVDATTATRHLPRASTASGRDALRAALRNALSAPDAPTLEDVERLAIDVALELHDGNKTAAGEALAVGRRVVERRGMPRARPTHLAPLARVGTLGPSQSDEDRGTAPCDAPVRR